MRERLERETATREVLSVISESRDDEAPVFNAILRQAKELCEAELSVLLLVNSKRTAIYHVGSYGENHGKIEAGLTIPIDDPMGVTTAVRTRKIVHNANLKDDDLYRQGHPTRVKLVDEEGIHAQLAVPLMQNGQATGVITLNRREAKAFSAGEIALVESFAAQAVIAIENVRQFREVQERLEREKATGEVLGVISTSRDDEIPVFRTILENASRICNAPIAFLSLANEERTEVTIPAHLGTRSEFGDILEDFLEPITRTELVAVRPVAIGVTVLEDDIKDDDAYRNGDPRRLQMVDVEGARSVLAVPLIRDGLPIGAIVLYRREVAPFSEDDLSLVQAFAAQAVIAIENVRQFREVQERLEREEATGEILGVISTSRDDDLPVFDVILENAARLCDAPVAALALANDERTNPRIAAYRGAQSDFLRSDAEPWPLDAPIFVAKAVRDNEIIHVEDLADDDLYPGRHPVREIAVNEEGVRSFIVVPLVVKGEAIGAIGLYRREKRKFAASDVDLVKTFAAQASIAIENVRQFKALETLNAELGERVDEQVGEIERMGRLKRFLPSAVADAVVTTGDESMLSSHRALVATLFCDMRGFTAFCESAEPEETIEVLQTYHQEMSDLIDEYGGGVDQRAGDGIMVIFNDPIPVDDPAGDAVRLAVAMRAKMKELCAGWKRLGHRLGFGVGVSLGYATVGMVGSAGRFDYTASGTSVNTAARLCDMAKDGEILISPRVWIAVEGDVQAESRGEVGMKGIREPVEVFAVV